MARVKNMAWRQWRIPLAVTTMVAGAGTALATIVNSARGSVAQAIILYEAALGLGAASRIGSHEGQPRDILGRNHAQRGTQAIH